MMMITIEHKKTVDDFPVLKTNPQICMTAVQFKFESFSTL